VRGALTIYLAGYYVIVGAAVVALWRSGVMERLDRTWTVTTIALAIALGVLLWFTSRR
jgi:hypothetical protein